jgi:NarL family two-component system response regulator LiaR
MLRMVVAGSSPCGPPNNKTAAPHIFLRPRSSLLAASVILLHNPIMKRHVLIFGLVGGLLIATLQYTEYRFVVIEHSVELYSALVAILFATFGIWLGLRITRRRDTMHETVVVKEVLVPADAAVPFAPNAASQQTLGITTRELEILTLVARGFSNREIAAQLFVSENTVKTHCARAFDKLGAARRTQAVQRGKELGLLP